MEANERPSDRMCPNCKTLWLDVLDDAGKVDDRHPGCSCVERYGPDEGEIDVYWPAKVESRHGG